MIWQMEPIGNDTQVTARSEIEPGGFIGVAGPLVAKSLRDSFDRDLTSLKAHLEVQA